MITSAGRIGTGPSKHLGGRPDSRETTQVAYLLFVDESGQDRRDSPYEVLAGAAIHDTRLWEFICQVQDAEHAFFGGRVSLERHELKAKRLLKRKTFRLAGQISPIPECERAALAAGARADGARANRKQITALAQAKIAFCRHVLELCALHSVRFFASIVYPKAPRPAGTGLRKDYAYLFQRFFYFVDDQALHERGLVVFDELERSRAHLLVDQMAAYFRETQTGRLRSRRIVPEPFFVHSDLTTGIQVADLLAYIVSWNVRVSRMRARRREELDDFGQMVLDLRYCATVDRRGYPEGFNVWSFAVIDDLRPRDERELEWAE